MLVSNQKYGSCLSSRHRFLVIRPIPKCHFSLTWRLSRLCGWLSVPSRLCARSTDPLDQVLRPMPQEPIVDNEAPHDGFRSEGKPTVISRSRTSSPAVTPSRSQTLGDWRHRSPPRAHFESDSQSLSPDAATPALGWSISSSEERIEAASSGRTRPMRARKMTTSSSATPATASTTRSDGLSFKRRFK